MAHRGGIGDISTKSINSGIVIEWSINDFLCLSEEDGAHYTSPPFSFDGEEWFLCIYPNGWCEKNSSGRIQVFLWKIPSGYYPNTLKLSVSLKAANGRRDYQIHHTRDFEDFDHHTFRCLIWRPALLRRKSEFLPSGVLTVVCTMKRETPDANTTITTSTTSGELFGTAASSTQSTGGLASDISSFFKDLRLIYNEIKAARTNIGLFGDHTKKDPSLFELTESQLDSSSLKYLCDSSTSPPVSSSNIKTNPGSSSFNPIPGHHLNTIAIDSLSGSSTPPAVSSSNNTSQDSLIPVLKFGASAKKPLFEATAPQTFSFSNINVNQGSSSFSSTSVTQLGTSATKTSFGSSTSPAFSFSNLSINQGSSSLNPVFKFGAPAKKVCSTAARLTVSSSAFNFRQDSSSFTSTTVLKEIKEASTQTQEVKILKEIKEASTQTQEEKNDVCLCQDFKKMLFCGRNHDIIIKVGDREFRAHRDVLRARSRVFESMFDHDMKEKNDDPLDIEDCDSEAMEQFLSYIYTGTVDNINQTSMLNLYYIADKYDMKGLKDACRDFIQKSLSLRNICGVIQLAMNHTDLCLLENATEYFIANVLEIMSTVEWQSFLKENSTVGNELLMKSIKKLKNT